MSRSGKFYDSPEWKKARARFLALNPLCQAPCCGARSERVDHKVSIAKGGAPLDPENFQALCRSHHNEKTARMDGGFGNSKTDGKPAWKGVGADGRPLDPAHPWNRERSSGR